MRLQTLLLCCVPTGDVISGNVWGYYFCVWIRGQATQIPQKVKRTKTTAADMTLTLTDSAESKPPIALKCSLYSS